MTTQIDDEALVMEIKALAAEHPDFEYSAPIGSHVCLYVDPTTQKGSCIVGQALERLGVPIEEIAQYDDPCDGGPAMDVLPAHGVSMTTAEWAHEVQRFQDEHYPWAEAVKLADEWADS